MNIAVIGLGLIGGSFAKSINAKTQHNVFGFDTNSETMMLARLCGAMDAPLDNEKLSTCDMIIIALTPEACVKWVEQNADYIRSDAILTDTCGIKRDVCGKIAPIAKEHGFMFIGGHPMAGKERGGFVNSSADVFNGAYMILTPDERTDMPTLEILKAFFTDLGFAGLTFTTTEEHDEMIAFTSQLAHIISCAYVKSPEALKHRGFSAGSFKDMTRVARLDENMWTELFLKNADNLSGQIGLLIDNLTELKTAVDSGDADKLKQLLKDGKEKKALAGGF